MKAGEPREFFGLAHLNEHRTAVLTHYCALESGSAGRGCDKTVFFDHPTPRFAASATWRSRAAVQHDTRGGGQPWSHARRPSPVESGNRGNAELGACGVRGCTGVGVKKVARDVRFDVMAGRTRCLNVTRYNRARHTKGSFCSFPPRHTKRRRRPAGEGGRVARAPSGSEKGGDG